MAPSSENKKRKRESTATAATPSKKTAAGHLAVSHSRPKALHPVLAATPGLTAPTLAFTTYTKSRSTSTTADTTPTPTTHDLILHSSQHPRLDYSAVPSDESQSHYLAVFDPATNSLQITPAHHLALRATLRTELQDVANDESRRTYAQQREELGREFGTKKAKKALLSKTENAIVKDSDQGKGKGRVDNVQTAILDNAAASSANVPLKEEVDQAQLEAKPIPRPNLSADTVDQVYKFSTLIPPSEARLVPVKDWQDAAQSEEAVMLSHRFPANRLAAVGKSEDTQRLQALRYLTLLLEFHDALQNAGKSGKKVPKKDQLSEKLAHWPTPLVDAVRRRFATPSNELPKWHMENLYTHMCALTLFIDGWTTNSTDLKEDLKMENKVISRYFLELGCKVAPPTERERETMVYNGKKVNKAQAAVMRMAKLKLPLEFPKVRVGRRK